jgi:hypothetical protein
VELHLHFLYVYYVVLIKHKDFFTVLTYAVRYFLQTLTASYPVGYRRLFSAV